MSKTDIKTKKVEFRVTDELKEQIEAAAHRLGIKASEMCTEILQRSIEMMNEGKKLEDLFAPAGEPCTQEGTKQKEKASQKKTPQRKLRANKQELLSAGNDTATVVIYATSSDAPSTILKKQKEIQDAGHNVRVVFEDGKYARMVTEDGNYADDKEENLRIIKSLKENYKTVRP